MTSCDAHAAGLLPIDDAVDRALSAAEAIQLARIDPVAELPLWDARGHVLAASVPADRDQPPFHRAAMDGFAFRAEDAGEAPLRVVGEVAAGQLFTGSVGPGEAVSIMTGAPVPVGADTVEMIERCQVGDGQVTIPGPATMGRHIARQGEDVRAGQTVVPAGRLIQGPTVGVLASVGAARVTVHRPPRVLVFATGDELVGIGETPEPHQIREGNRHTLMAILGAVRASVADGGLVADTKEALRDAIRKGLSSDVIALSGGVSKGKYDLVREVLDDLGMETLFHGVQAKPGKPALVGRLENTLVFGLPGNPVSTYVMGVLLLLPAVRTIAGLQDPRTRTVKARLRGELPAAKGRTTYHPAKLAAALGQGAEVAPSGGGGPLHGEAEVRPVSWNGSGDLTGYAAGNCLVRMDIGAAAATDGDLVTVLLCG